MVAALAFCVSGYQTETTACAFHLSGCREAPRESEDRPMVAEADAGETGGGGADERGGRNRESESGKERWSVPYDARAAARDSRGRGSNLGLARRWGELGWLRSGPRRRGGGASDGWTLEGSASSSRAPGASSSSSTSTTSPR